MKEKVAIHICDYKVTKGYTGTNKRDKMYINIEEKVAVAVKKLQSGKLLVDVLNRLFKL